MRPADLYNLINYQVRFNNPHTGMHDATATMRHRETERETGRMWCERWRARRATAICDYLF